MSEPYTIPLFGCEVTVDPDLGKIAVAHDGSLDWDTLFEIKCRIWGDEARAIEVYPARSALVNARPCRHLWRLGDADFCPDLLGPVAHDDRLQSRYATAWAGTA